MAASGVVSFGRRSPLPNHIEVAGFNGVQLERPRGPQGGWAILHPTTLERVELPPPTGTYFLEWFDEDVSVCDIGSDAFFEGESLFLKLIVRDTRSGELQIAWWMRNKQRWRFFDLHDMMTDYRNLRSHYSWAPRRS